mgnify:CR=1 FL=1
MTTQRFHLGAVLSMTTGKLLCQMDDIYRIAAHLAGGPVWTHQLGRVMTESKPHLLTQFPALAAVTGEEVTHDNFAPMPADAHESIDPLSELAETVHPDRIVTIAA